MHRLVLLVLVATLFATTACSETSVTQDAAVNAAWNALDLVTTSHNRENFQVVIAREVAGKEVAKEFANERTNSYCWGTRVPANSAIGSDTRYWYVHFKRRVMTPLLVTRVSPTQPPAIPDWNIPEAFFLIDARTGAVVARNILCVVI
jgi:hypothetical protein